MTTNSKNTRSASALQNVETYIDAQSLRVEKLPTDSPSYLIEQAILRALKIRLVELATDAENSENFELRWSA